MPSNLNIVRSKTYETQMSYFYSYVLAAFGSVTVARINTCCYTGVVNVHGNLVKYIDEQETSVNICAAQRQKTNNS